MKEVSRRYDAPIKDFFDYAPKEFLDFLKDQTQVPKEIMKQRREHFMFHYKPNELILINGVEAKKIIELYMFHKIDPKTEEIKGMVVSRGPVVKGKAKILLTPKEIHKMHKGDILVAPMTSPEYIVALRKASALITDEGGMTCHAAIDSRELGIPCIASTKIATKAIKDDDQLEVDSNQGTITILK